MPQRRSTPIGSPPGTMRLEPDRRIPGVRWGFPRVHADRRGFFLEIFREDALGTRFVQANHSHSRPGSLRGLHYHRKQADAWYVLSGEAQVVLADLRTPSDSPVVVSEDVFGKDPRVLFIPPGVAHGFLAITQVDLIYWVTQYYDSSDEFGVAWNDPTLDVSWRTRRPMLSERDQSNPPLDWNSIPVSW